MTENSAIGNEWDARQDREPLRNSPTRGNRAQLPSGLQTRHSISAQAMLLGERIDIRRLAASEWIVSNPALWTVGAEGIAFVFRYGVVVLFNCTDAEQARFLHDVWPQVVSPADRTESESVTLRQALDHEESVDLDAIWLHDFTTERLQLVAWVLSKSVVLAEYESRVARNFDHVEPLAVELQSRQRGGPSMKKLLELLQNRRSHRVEWYIVILIVFEILLTLYEMFVRHR